MLRRGSSLTLAIFNTLLMLRCGRSLAILHALLMLRCGSSLAFFFYTLLMLRCGPSLAIFNTLLMPCCGRSQLQKIAPSKPWRCNMQNHKNHLKNHRKTMKNQHDVTWLQLKRVVTMNWNQHQLSRKSFGTYHDLDLSDFALLAEGSSGAWSGFNFLAACIKQDTVRAQSRGHSHAQSRQYLAGCHQ